MYFEILLFDYYSNRNDHFHSRIYCQIWNKSFDVAYPIFHSFTALPFRRNHVLQTMCQTMKMSNWNHCYIIYSLFIHKFIIFILFNSVFIISICFQLYLLSFTCWKESKWIMWFLRSNSASSKIKNSFEPNKYILYNNSENIIAINLYFFSDF